MDENKQPGIQIAQIFLELATFSHRDDVLTLPATTPFEPNLVVDVQGGIGEDEKNAFVRVTVHTKPKERPLYNFHVTMMALLKVAEGKENLSLKEYVQTVAPAMLYPFVREAVAGLTWRGRFGPVWLAPLNIGAALSSPSEPETLPKIQESPSKGRAKAKKRAKAHS